MLLQVSGHVQEKTIQHIKVSFSHRLAQFLHQFIRSLRIPWHLSAAFGPGDGSQRLQPPGSVDRVNPFRFIGDTYNFYFPEAP